MGRRFRGLFTDLTREQRRERIALLEELSETHALVAKLRAEQGAAEVILIRALRLEPGFEHNGQLVKLAHQVCCRLAELDGNPPGCWG